MNKKFWIKLYMEVLDDPKMGRLPDNLWRFAVELFLLAGREAKDGSLPSLAEMAWGLRRSEEKVLEELRGLAEVGIVTEIKEGEWRVTHFQERQQCESSERVKRYRNRYNNAVCNGEVAEVPSTSTSTSESNSDSESEEEVGVQGEGKPSDETDKPNVPRALPSTPVEAMLHPDVRVFAGVTGGRIPGLSQYRAVIDTVRLLRRRNKLDDQALAEFLKPYWLAWSSRKRQDGRLYDPGNITWLVEWALNGTIPPNRPPGNAGGQNPETVMQENEDVIRRVARGEE